MPFQITTDPRFLWLGEKHTEALATLKYGVLENKGFLLLIGDVGMGKTALINRLVEMIKASAIVAKMPDPGLSNLDFFNILAIELKMNKKFDSKGAFLIYLKKFLYKADSHHKKVVLIIDEAQRLSHELLEQIRLLSNIELDNRKLINIFFVGQTEFGQMLLEERNRAVRQRITVSYHIEPLTESETRAYIKHRLKIAGATREIFSKDAVREIFSFSAGYPRLINIVCDHALLTGYVSGLKSIDQKVIRECEKELQIPLIDGIESDIGRNENTTNQDQVAPPIPEKKSGLKRIGVIAAIIMLLVLGISFFTNQKTNDEPRRETYKIAPQEHKGPLPDESQNQKNPAVQFNAATDVKPAEETPQSDNRVNKQIPALQNEKSSTTDNQQPISEEKARMQLQETITPIDDQDKIAMSVPPEVVPPPKRKIIIYFKRKSNEVPDQSFEALNKIANFMLKNPSATLDINGYSDSMGSSGFNKTLSQFRANTLKIYLVGKSVDPAKIQAIGLGAENPIASNETEEGRQKNRRVELELNFNYRN
jgi:general secretion pathway protein A